VLQRPAQAINGLGSNEINLAARHRLEHGIEGRTLVATFGAADALVLEYLDDIPAFVAATASSSRRWLDVA
jgi:hypothetical protein